MTVAADEFTAYRVGICSASACTSLSDDDAIMAMNAAHPTGIDSPWWISEEPTFRTGEPNPCPCPDSDDHRHVLFVC